MLSYINVVVTNQMQLGGILIESELNSEYESAIRTNCSDFRILKRCNGSKNWDLVYQGPILDTDSLRFKFLDILTVAGKSYSYCVDLLYGDRIVETQVFSNILFEFGGLFVGNFNSQFVSGVNFKTENVKRNKTSECITTLYNKYPFYVSYSDSDYYTGTSTGLFMELTSDKKQFVPDNYHTYFDIVMNFLCDGTEKIVKTHDGRIWYVVIDATPSEVYSDYQGMNAIQFSWTEIGELPTYGLAGVE